MAQNAWEFLGLSPFSQKKVHSCPDVLVSLTMYFLTKCSQMTNCCKCIWGSGMIKKWVSGGNDKNKLDCFFSLWYLLVHILSVCSSLFWWSVIVYLRLYGHHCFITPLSLSRFMHKAKLLGKITQGHSYCTKVVSTLKTNNMKTYLCWLNCELRNRCH